MSKIFPYGVKAPGVIPATADEILDEYFVITSELNISTCLAYGLCLGFVRDGGYIKGDNDLDVVAIVENDETRELLHTALLEHGFIFKQHFPPPGNNIHYVKNDILLDIFMRNMEGFYDKFDWIEYKGRKYPVPHPVEKYLCACYKNWQEKLEEEGEDGKKGI